MPILLQLFFAFIQVGLFSVGGGYAAIPLIQNQIVDVHHLMTLGEFTDLITIAEMTPGPISINSATFVGTRLAGIPGSILCTLGCIIPSFCICLALAHFYYKYRNFSGVQTVLSALRPAVVALIASAGLSSPTSVRWRLFCLSAGCSCSESTASTPSPSSLAPALSAPSPIPSWEPSPDTLPLSFINKGADLLKGLLLCAIQPSGSL